MGRIVLAFIALLVVAAGAQLVLETARRPTAVINPTPTASATSSATATATTTPSRPAPPTPTPYVPTPAPPPPATVTISGAGSSHSKAFGLNDMTGYLARYTLGSACQYDAHLHLTDESYDNADFIVETGPMSSAKVLNNVPIGKFYVAMTTGRGCSWSITFVPR
jgi:hypothetical protein